jgi:peptidoglycan/xylan/chitin deacetylase (PgdA/CDA1 family)
MEIADIFEENEGTATFFLIGQNIEKDGGADIAEYLYLKGNELANHSYSHATAAAMDAMSEEEFSKEIDGTNQLIKNITGSDPKFFRGGGYAYSQRVYERLEMLDLTAIGYHTSVGSDYSGGSATTESIIDTLRNASLPDGAVIIGHASNSLRITPEALKVVLPELYNQGYRFCSMSELIQYKGVEYDNLPVHCYVNRIETKDDGSTKIHTQFRMYLDTWKTHPEDYKLLAFTFDDGPSANDTKFVDLFKKYKGSATFFVTGTNCNTVGYSTLQYAINNGWDIGNHSMTHADAWSGSGDSYTELTYEQLKYQISDFNTLLESNLTMADGKTPYEVSLYRPPQIRYTDTMFKVCTQEDMSIIWALQNTYDWDGTKDYSYRLKHMQNGVGTWNDGDVILGHVWSNDTYNAMVETFDAFYDAGYRFCSITELMEYRGINRSDISGKLNNVNGNKGMVRNIVASATYGKSTD